VNLAETGPSRGDARRAGLLLHGRERLPEEMLDIADRLNIDAFRWLAPAADGGTWYPFRFTDPFDVNEPFIAQAMEACDTALTELRDGGRLTSTNLAIVGFSQGACIASEYVLRHPGCCAVLVMFTGGIIGHDIRRWLVSGVRLEGLRVFLTGSDADEWIPESRSRLTETVFTALGADVRMRLYKGKPHIVSDDEIEEARVLLEAL
jgi:phospholipase/carboxylesterase